MEFAAVVRELEKSGSEQTRKTYTRHGIGPNMYGVSFAKLGEMAKRIKVDQALAEKLWATGNFDCRQLAAMILDPAKVKKSTLNAWVKSYDCRCACDRLARAVAGTPHAVELASKWCEAKTERENWAGWTTIAELAVAAEPDDDLDEMFAACVPVIEQKLQSSPNYTRYVMNNALIAIGGRTPTLKKLALSAAKKIGPVDVDHGDTACKTPNAKAYIEKIWARKKSKSSK